MPKITAKELTKLMKVKYNKRIDWLEFTDLIAIELIGLGYMQNEFDEECNYIWNQVDNFWKVFCKRKN